MRSLLRHSLGRLSLACAVGFVLTAPCLGQVDGAHVTVGPTAGYVDWSNDLNLDNAPHYGGNLGLWLNGHLGLEGQFTFSSTQTQHNGLRWIGALDRPGVDQDLTLYGVNLIYNIAPEEKFSTFLLGGWQEAKYDANDVWPEQEYLNGGQVGFGFLYWVAPRMLLRAEVRDWMLDLPSPPTPNPPGDAWTQNLSFAVGIQLAFGGQEISQDADQDGVRDKKDMCPDTPLGARVDLSGCPIDSDGDGVPDGLDQCAGTPVGARVDVTGCPSDSDKDGVPDGIDQCAGTPAGAPVDAKGCPLDADRDGVFDGLDKCPNTPTGAKVDDSGCPTDADRDGVFDGLDKCPNTPANARVDVDGCPIMISEKEVEMLDTGKITVRNINFDTGKWTIRPESFKVLDEIGGILIQWPDLRVEIGGHTDSRGSDAMNQTLSEKRANAVRDYLLSQFPQLSSAQYTAVGYGEKQPIADNTTETGLAKNRRVEFKVLNTEVLKKEKERRQMLQK